LSSSIRVTILGREYTLRSQGDTDQVERVVSFVETRLADMNPGKNVDTRDLTVLTLLNLAGQYLQLLDETQAAQGEDQRLGQIVGRLERVLAED